jgi:hypothetical protein
MATLPMSIKKMLPVAFMKKIKDFYYSMSGWIVTINLVVLVFVVTSLAFGKVILDMVNYAIIGFWYSIQNTIQNFTF